MSDSHDLGDVDHFTVAVDDPSGLQTFLLQARTGAETVTVEMARNQVAALASYLGELLGDLPAPGHLPEDLDLEEPYTVAWVAGSLAATYDKEIDRVVLLVEEAIPYDEDESIVPADARFTLTREQAAAVAIRGTQLAEDDRPRCPLCGHPLDPSGHACPRTNGNRPPQI